MGSATNLSWVFRHPWAALTGAYNRLRYPSYKRQVGPPKRYDALGEYQFELLKLWGLLPQHSLLDIGCGSLRAGRYFIPYLESGKYFGIEPDRHLVESGIGHNLDEQTLREKRPAIRYDADFDLGAFHRTFDFLLAHAIFTHASQAQIRKCFYGARRAMSPNSMFCATYNKGDSDYLGERWIYHARDCDEGLGRVSYTFACLAGLAGEAGLACAEVDAEHPSGSSWIMACLSGCQVLSSGRIGPHRISTEEVPRRR